MNYSLWVMLLATLLCGCPKSIPKPDNAIEDPVELRGAVDARLDQVTSARFTEVVLEYFGEGQRVKVRQLLLAKKPSFIRVQTRVPGTEEILNLLVSNGETFSMHKRDTNEFMTGPATAQNIAKLLPVDLSANDVMRVMLGGAPWDRWDQFRSDPTLEWDKRLGLYRLQRIRGETKFTLWVRHTDFAVIQATETESGDTVYEYTTDDWEKQGAVALPNYRRFVLPKRKLDFSLDVRETQIDPDLPDLLFELDPPDGSTIITLP